MQTWQITTDFTANTDGEGSPLHFPIRVIREIRGSFSAGRVANRGKRRGWRANFSGVADVSALTHAAPSADLEHSAQHEAIPPIPRAEESASFPGEFLVRFVRFFAYADVAR